MIRTLGRRGFLVGASALCVSQLYSRNASAGVAPGVSLPKLAADSSFALVGVARSAESRWVRIGRQKRIVTRTRVSVQQVVHGARVSEVMIETLGGRVGSVGQVVHGEAVLLLGERSLLFLQRADETQFWVSHFAQGHYPVRGKEARLFPSPRTPELVGRSRAAARQLVGRRLSDALDDIHRAFRDAHR